MIYYNEFHEETALWLQELINRGLIPQGRVDTRSITEVDPEELKQYTQCHFFAGIGGWSRALDLANISTDFNIWTGSCPCQPFSVAGSHTGLKDERNLWKVFYDLIKEVRPTVVVGEQVEAAVRHGWLDIVEDDLEACEYATASAVLTASMLDAPHTRRRLYWGAIQKGALEDTNGVRLARVLSVGDQKGCARRVHSCSEECILSRQRFWDDGVWQEGTTGDSYLLERGTFPLVNGVSNRVVKCRGYGNAIVPQVGAFFVNALLG